MATVTEQRLLATVGNTGVHTYPAAEVRLPKQYQFQPDPIYFRVVIQPISAPEVKPTAKVAAIVNTTCRWMR
jgi:hypothetical protein